MMLTRSLVPLLGLCALTTHLPAHAEDGFAQFPIVLSVSRLQQPQSDAPGAMTVLDRDLIQASGARKLSELLRLVPGFEVGDPGQDPARVTYHGLAELFPSRLQVLVDGRSLYSPLYFGGINWDMIPVALENIARIEVMRGPNSAAYGANAFLGVVNIITLAPAEARGLRLNLRQGGEGIADRFLSWGEGNAQLDWRASYSDQREDGLDTIADEQHNQLFNFAVDLHPSLQDTLSLALDSQRGKTRLGHEGDRCNPLVAPHADAHQIQLGWRRDLETGHQLAVSYRYADEGLDSVQSAECDGIPITIDLGARAQRQELELQHTLPLDDTARLVWGAAWQQQRLFSRLYYGDSGRRQQQNARMFGNLEWRLAPAWLLNLGGSVEHISDGGERLAPRFSLHHQLARHQTLRLGLSRAYRFPSLSERSTYWLWRADDGSAVRPEFLSSNTVAPERIDAAELGYLGEWRPQGVSLDVRLFAEHLPNRIGYGPIALAGDPWCPGPAPCATARSALNSEDVRIRGLEYQLRWQALPSTRLMLNQAFVHIRSNLQDGVFAESAAKAESRQTQTEHSAPQLNTTAMLTHDFSLQWNASLIHYRLGAMQWTSNSHIDTYDRTDLRIARRFRWSGRNVEFAYTGQSLNGRHSEYRSSWTVAPHHMLSLSIGL